MSADASLSGNNRTRGPWPVRHFPTGRQYLQPTPLDPIFSALGGANPLGVPRHLDPRAPLTVGGVLCTGVGDERIQQRGLAGLRPARFTLVAG